MMFIISETTEYKVQGEVVNNRFALHLRVYKWSASVYKDLLNLLAEIMEYAKSRGYDEIYTGAPSNDFKVLKCQQMFGFEYAGYHKGTTLMVQRI